MRPPRQIGWVISVEARGGQATAVGVDVPDSGSVQGLVEATLAAYRRLDAALNNATDGPMPAPLAEIDPGEFGLGIATNIRGTFLGMKYQLGAMLRTGDGGQNAGVKPPQMYRQDQPMEAA